MLNHKELSAEDLDCTYVELRMQLLQSGHNLPLMELEEACVGGMGAAYKHAVLVYRLEEGRVLELGTDDVGPVLYDRHLASDQAAHLVLDLIEAVLQPHFLPVLAPLQHFSVLPPLTVYFSVDSLILEKYFSSGRKVKKAWL